jgi:hypothetical protein
MRERDAHLALSRELERVVDERLQRFGDAASVAAHWRNDFRLRHTSTNDRLAFRLRSLRAPARMAVARVEVAHVAATTSSLERRQLEKVADQRRANCSLASFDVAERGLVARPSLGRREPVLHQRDVSPSPAVSGVRKLVRDVSRGTRL